MCISDLYGNRFLKFSLCPSIPLVFVNILCWNKVGFPFFFFLMLWFDVEELITENF